MAANMSSIMDVDPPAGLKRSNSAPMINELNSNMAAAGAAPSVAAAVRETSALSLMQPRTRRFSGSSFSSHSTGSSPRPSPRVSQLKQEEIDVARSEAAHEKEIHSAIQMSQSCEDLTLVAGSLSCSDNESDRRVLGPRLDPVYLNVPPHSPVCSSPSPTRSGLNRQLFTPTSIFGTSPTRKSSFTRRSQSPIAMRPSTLGPAVKRKFELDEAEQHRSPPTKRMSTGNGGGNGSGLLMAHRLDQGSSPLPGSLSSVGTPDSMSSADSPNFTFRPVDSPSPGRAHIGPSEHSPS